MYTKIFQSKNIKLIKKTKFLFTFLSKIVILIFYFMILIINKHVLTMFSVIVDRNNNR